MLAWLRTRRWAVVLTGGATLLALVQTLLGFANARIWIRVVGACVVAAVALLSLLDQQRTKRRDKIAAEKESHDAAAAVEQKWLQHAEEWLRLWPVPRIDEAHPLAMGVRQAICRDAQDPPDNGTGPYIRRDIDQEAALQLRANGRLLLVGEPGSGVTRTALHAAQSGEAKRSVLAPRAPNGLQNSLNELDVLSRLRPPTRLVLWLDKINEFAPNGVTVSLLKRCASASPRLRIVATISSMLYESWHAEQSELAAFFGDHIRVRRLPSAQELAAAERLYPGRDFSHGIGSAFTGAGSLLARLTGGNITCPFEPIGGDCALSRALMNVVFSWYASGTPRPLKKSQAAQLALASVSELTKDTDGHVEACFAWACQRIPEGVSLLSEKADDNGEAVLQTHMEVTEIVAAQTNGDSFVWPAALRDADTAGDSDAVGRMGYTAHIGNRLALAEEAWERLRDLSEPGVEWLRRAETYSRWSGELRNCISPLENLLRLTESAYTRDDPHVADLLYRLGTTWRELGQPGRARAVLRRALAIQERKHGPDHSDVAVTLNELGLAWLNFGKHDKAREILERALAIQERVYGPDHVAATITLGNIASVWLDLGLPGKAKDLLERALTIQERDYGAAHPAVADTLSDLGRAWGDLGDLEKARGFFERALSIKESTFGSDHIEITTALGNLGTAWFGMGRPDKARELLERTLIIQRRTYGPDHIEVATTLDNLGGVWYKLGEPKKARDLVERALNIEERLYGPNHPMVAGSLNDLAITCSELGDLSRARDLLQRALTIQERIYGPDHPALVITLINLGVTWRKIGNAVNSRKNLKRALAIQRRHFPNGHPRTKRLVYSLREFAPDQLVLDDGRLVRGPDSEP